MASENPTWGAPRIHGELLKLGEATVSRYMPLRREPPSQTWRTFLRNHAEDLVSIDFFVVPTATFRILYVFLVLEHERRRIMHFNVTGPTCLRSRRWARLPLPPFPASSGPRFCQMAERFPETTFRCLSFPSNRDRVSSDRP